MARGLDFDIDIPPAFSTEIFSVALLKAKPGTARATRFAAPPAIELSHCYKPWQTCSIGELGDVRACGIYWRSAGRIVRRGGFEEIWNGRKYRQLRRGINQRPDSICFDCRLPRFGSDAGLLVGELRPSPKQMTTELVQSRLHPRSVRFDGVLDRDYDPHAQP